MLLPLTRRLAVILLTLAGTIALPPAGALASHSQVSIMQDDLGLGGPNPDAVLAKMRALGVQQVRFPARWVYIAPNPNSYKVPKGFSPSNPSAKYYNWGQLDMVVREAAKFGISVDLDVVGGAPNWALGPGAKSVPATSQGHNVWEPNAAMLGQFVKALGTRYSGSYNPVTNRTVKNNPDDLPRVSFWSVWNEPDYGPSLAPQGRPGHLTVEYSPYLYRNLVDQAWNALQHTGHAKDTFLFGELAPRGRPSWGVFSGMKPLIFMRALYCVDSRYRPLRGTAAALRGCPTTTSGSRRFRSQHPGLFNATGLADHPYMRW
ncbi:MAG: hypothetical protein QOG59_574, partial [Solirubrobacteraceae bacterium]|nr:hypothetical protein [Solirubrobacteraceae bacterium]